MTIVVTCDYCDERCSGSYVTFFGCQYHAACADKQRDGINKTNKLIEYLKKMKDPQWREFWAAIDWICFNLKDKDINEILK